MTTQDLGLSAARWSKRFFLDVARWAPVVLAVKEYVGEPRQVEGRSMQPTMNSTRAWWRIGDLLLLDRWHVRSRASPEPSHRQAPSPGPSDDVRSPPRRRAHTSAATW